MAEIKRPNYFTNQFLIDRDFNDEQAYHRLMRLRHNRLLHGFGVADGMVITRSDINHVQISAGTAIDSSGREMVFDDARLYQLTAGGTGADVYLTIAYQEAFDPADHYTQGSVDNFTRATERPVLADSTTPPPSDGTVILLARIHLNSQSQIESDGSIDMTTRPRVSARLAPKTVTTDNLVDGSVTFQKLDPAVRPRVTMVSGTVTFTNLVTMSTVSGAPSTEQFSDDIDPGFGPGAVAVQLGLDDVPDANKTISGDLTADRPVRLRSIVDKTTGRFKVFALRTAGSGAAKVRWFAFSPQAGADSTVAIKVTSTPSTVAMAGNVTQTFTAVSTNAVDRRIQWSAPAGGTLGTATDPTATAPASVQFTSPGISGPYQVKAASVADTTNPATSSVSVTAAVAVNISQTSAGLFPGGQITLGATVINTSDTAITWSIQSGGLPGQLSTTSGGSTVTTAPSANTGGTYVVVATSHGDPTKSATCTVTVTPISVSISPTSVGAAANEAHTFNASVNVGALNWSVSPNTGSLSVDSTTHSATYSNGSGGTYTLRATSTLLSAAFATATMDVTPPSTPGGGGGGGKAGPSRTLTVSGGPPVSEDIISNSSLKSIATKSKETKESAGKESNKESKGKARVFIRPHKRPKGKLP